jgi:hypothetical protein
MTDPEFENQVRDKIRTHGRSLAGLVPVSPGAPRRRASASVRMRPGASSSVVGVLVAAVIIVIAVSRLGSSATIPPPSSSIGPTASGSIPWAAIPVPSRAPDQVVTEPPCEASDLAASSLAFSGFAAGMEGFAGTISLKAAQACVLPNAPSVSFETTMGKAIAIAQAPNSETAPVTLTPTSNAGTVDLQIFGACAVADLRKASVTLAQGDVLQVEILPPPVSQGGSCLGSATYLLRFAAPEVAPSSAANVPSLKVVLTTAARATRGQPYRYIATLTNFGATRVLLDPCPAYDEGLKIPAGFSQSFSLNCLATAGFIDPGASVSFEMFLAIPASAPSGQYELDWDIEGTDIGAGVMIEID